MLLCLLHRNCRREHPHYLLHTKSTEATKDRIGSGQVQLYRVFHRKRFSSNTYSFLSAKPTPRKPCHLSVLLSYDASTCSSGSIIVSGRIICPMIPVRCAIWSMAEPSSSSPKGPREKTRRTFRSINVRVKPAP